MPTKPKTPSRNLRHRLTIRAGIWAVGTIPRLPFRIVRLAGRAIGLAAWWLGGTRRQRTLEHLSRALPDVSDGERRAIARESFLSVGAVFAETCWIPAMSKEWCSREWDLETPEAFERIIAAAKARGLVILTGHVGSWEMALQYFQFITPEAVHPVLAVAARPSLEELAEPMKGLRESHGARIVWRGDAGLPMVRHLRKGGCAAMLVDHNLRGEGAEVLFFGQPAHTLLAPARLALRTRAALTIMYSLRKPDGRYGLYCADPMELPEPAGTPEDRLRQEIELTTLYTNRIEEIIRRHPGQWMWMHRRWQRRRKNSLYWQA